MRPSNKSRNRNKNSNRRGSPGNNINRVFESAGPEGRVRGTPQQIIDKYLSLTYDAQLSGDRVAAENFQQHAEHYSRLLIEAQKELADKQTDQTSNIAPAKGKLEFSNEAPSALDNQTSTIQKQEEKIVNFDKSIDRESLETELIDNSENSQKKATSRKVLKKKSVTDPETLEV